MEFNSAFKGLTELENCDGVIMTSCMLSLAKFDEEVRKKTRRTLTHTETDRTKTTALHFLC